MDVEPIKHNDQLSILLAMHCSSSSLRVSTIRAMRWQAYAQSVGRRYTLTSAAPAIHYTENGDFAATRAAYSDAKIARIGQGLVRSTTKNAPASGRSNSNAAAPTRTGT
jgi:hypothetical protein